MYKFMNIWIVMKKFLLFFMEREIVDKKSNESRERPIVFEIPNFSSIALSKLATFKSVNTDLKNPRENVVL